VAQPAIVSRLVRTGTSKGQGIDQDYYVQVRYPHGLKWVTVSMASTRGAASAAAAVAYEGLVNAGGEVPRQCRIVSAGQLVREDGERGVRIADVDIARRADPPKAP
jgi:hypothetical protein